MRDGIKALLLLLCVAVWTLPAIAQDDYAVEAIPVHLTERADATVRNEHVSVEMRSPTQVVIKIARTVTVHNRNGDHMGAIELYYNKSRKVRSVKGQILDEWGRAQRKFSMRDFTDRSASGQANLYDDLRVKNFDPRVPHYPYTITYEAEIRQDQNLFIPSWMPDYQYDVAVEKSSFSFTAAATEALRIHETHFNGQSEVIASNRTKTYTWSVSDISAKRSEPFSPPRLLNATTVRIVPEKFQYFKKVGQFTDWEGYGKWMYDELLADKRDLPASTIDYARELTENLATDQEKARALYSFLQEKTRYISIQIGIGGLEPFPASSVDKLGYGDCKALVIYMQSLLDAVDIPSYYCIVEAGSFKRDLTVDFANVADGNHVILCIPFENDTTWLECTSQRLPFGFLGDFTDDRIVVACTEEGGKLLRTPKFDAEQSLQQRQGAFDISPEGHLRGTLKTVFQGNQLDNHYGTMFQSPQEQRKSLRQIYDVNNIRFEEIRYELRAGDTLKVEEVLDLSVDKHLVFSGDVAYIIPNIFNVSGAIPRTRNRTQDVFINRGFTDVDELHYTLPENLVPFVIPANERWETPMASYEFSTQIKDGVLVTYRRFQLREGTYPAETYEEFQAMIAKIQTIDTGRYRLQLSTE